jgi:RNA polymerase sigma-70 factor (ECF subfamily)
MDALIQRAQRGEHAAIEELLKAYAPDITRIAHRFLGPNPDLEDVVQEALFQVARSVRSFEGHSKFSTWLYRVVANVTRMHLRHKASRPVLELSEPTLLAHRAVVTRTPEHQSQQADDARRLYRHLDALSEKKRTVLVLHDLDGVSAQEIAGIVDAPLLTVRTRLFYARKELYASLARDPELTHLELGDDAHEPRDRPRASVQSQRDHRQRSYR